MSTYDRGRGSNAKPSPPPLLLRARREAKETHPSSSSSSPSRNYPPEWIPPSSSQNGRPPPPLTPYGRRGLLRRRGGRGRGGRKFIFYATTLYFPFPWRAAKKTKRLLLLLLLLLLRTPLDKSKTVSRAFGSIVFVQSRRESPFLSRSGDPPDIRNNSAHRIFGGGGDSPNGSHDTEEKTLNCLHLASKNCFYFCLKYVESRSSSASYSPPPPPVLILSPLLNHNRDEEEGFPFLLPLPCFLHSSPRSAGGSKESQWDMNEREKRHKETKSRRLRKIAVYGKSLLPECQI